MSDAYAGHMADGSSVQKHSAGGLYPFVLYSKTAPSGSGLVWGWITPDGVQVEARHTYDQAVFRCEAAKAVYDAKRAALRGIDTVRYGRKLPDVFWRMLEAAKVPIAPLETLSGEPRVETPTPEQQADAPWFDKREFDCWYDELVRTGATTDQEIGRMQLALIDELRGGAPMPAEMRARYDALRAHPLAKKGGV